MDFLRIRQKAKERAEAQRAAEAPPPASLPPLAGGGPGRGAPPPDDDRIEDVLRAELACPPAQPPEEAPPPAPPAPAPADDLDEFFWREDERAPGWPEALLPAAPRAPAEPPEQCREWLTFLLGGEEYAVAIEHVREILKAPAVTEVPRAPDHVLGVIMVRGEVIAVVDPRRRLGLPPGERGRSSRVIVCDAGEGSRGLLVDAVSQVVRLPASAVEARPTGIGGAGGEYITGLGRERDRLYILLDLSAVLHDGPAAEGPP